MILSSVSKGWSSLGVSSTSVKVKELSATALFVTKSFAVLSNIKSDLMTGIASKLLLAFGNSSSGDGEFKIGETSFAWIKLIWFVLLLSSNSFCI